MSLGVMSHRPILIARVGASTGTSGVWVVIDHRMLMITQQEDLMLLPAF